jgi:oligopeptide transport system substrate-binding protein
LKPARVLVPPLALLAALLAGCGRRETPVEQGNREQVLHRGVGYEVTGLDPALETGIAEQAIDSELFEGLVAEDPRDLHPVPGVASSWEQAPDGLSYTFHLRPQARWSNGDPVTAGDFIAAWRRVLTPSLGASYATELYVLQGAEAFNKGLTRDFTQVGVSAPDARTLRVALEHPCPSFLSLLSLMPWLPVNLASIEAKGPAYSRGTPWTRPGNLVGNGPFVLTEWKADSVIVARKSPTYWDAGSVRLREIHFYPIDSLDAEERAFRAGQLHITDAIPVSRIEESRRDLPQCLRVDPYLGTYFYRLNVRRPFLSDARVRRALSLAVDRQAIVSRITRGGQAPAASFTPGGLGGYEAPVLARTDFEAARRLLAEAGHPRGEGLPPLELLFNNSESHRLIAEAVQETWRRELGIVVRLSNQEEKTALAARRAGDYDILKSDWIADYPDPASFLEVWRSDSGNNETGWSNADYDSALFAASRAPDPASRNALYRKAETILLESAPIIPVYFYTHVFLIRPSVHGWYPTLLDHHPCKAVWLSNGAP